MDDDICSHRVLLTIRIRELFLKTKKIKKIKNGVFLKKRYKKPLEGLTA